MANSDSELVLNKHVVFTRGVKNLTAEIVDNFISEFITSLSQQWRREKIENQLFESCALLLAK